MNTADDVVNQLNTSNTTQTPHPGAAYITAKPPLLLSGIAAYQNTAANAYTAPPGLDAALIQFHVPNLMKRV